MMPQQDDARTSAQGITKILVWRNPGAFGSGIERWDIEVVDKDGSRERMVSVAPEDVKRLLELGERMVAEPEV